MEQIIKVSGISTAWTDHTVLPPEPPKRQWLEPVFFLLGAAYFDSKDWPTAVSVFDKYRQLFPSSPHLTQAIFSEAQANLWGGRPQDSIPQFTLLLPLPDYHVKAFLLLVEANFRAGKPDAAIR